MAGELCLLRCPNPSTDPSLFVDFFQKHSSSPSKRQFLTSGDPESLELVQRFAQALGEQTILLNYRWDKLHTSETREPKLNFPSLRYVSDFFGQESQEDFQERIRDEVFTPRDINKIVLVSKTVIDLIAGMLTVQGDFAVLEVSSDNRVKNFLTYEQFSSFERNAKPEKPLGKSSNQSGEPAKPPSRHKIGNVQLSKSAFVSERNPMIEDAVQNHQRSPLNPQVDLLKAQILSVIKEGLEGIASIPGQNSNVKEALVSFETQIVSEVRRFVAQTQELLQSSVQRTAKSLEKTLTEFKLEHDRYKSQVEDGIRRLRKQQEDMGTLISTLTAQLQHGKPSPNPGYPEKLTNKIAAYERLNELVLDQIQKLSTLAKSVRLREKPIVIENFESGGTEDDTFFVEVLNKKPYAIEPVDLFLEVPSKKLQIKILPNLKLSSGTSRLPVKLPPEHQGKLLVFALQEKKEMSEKAEFAMEVEAEQADHIPELQKLESKNLIEEWPRQQEPPKTEVRPAPSVVSVPKPGLQVAGQPNPSLDFPWMSQGQSNSSDNSQKAGPVSSFAPNPYAGSPSKPGIPQIPPVSTSQRIKPDSENLQKDVSAQLPILNVQAKPEPRKEGNVPVVASNQEPAKLVPQVQPQKPGIPDVVGPKEERKVPLGQPRAPIIGFDRPVPSSRQTGSELPGSKGKAKGASPLEKPIILTQATGAAVPKPPGLSPEEDEKIKAVSELLGEGFSEGTMKDLIELLKTDKGKVMTNDELVGAVFKF